MSVIRAFIAIDLSADIQHRLDEVQQNYKAQLANTPIRWVVASNIHLTLKFLGDVSLSNLNILTDMISAEISRHHQFDISVGGSGAFPNISPATYHLGWGRSPTRADSYSEWD